MSDLEGGGNGDVASSDAAEVEGRHGRGPWYPRLLRLRHVHPAGWQRLLFCEGTLLAAAVLVLADVASAWTLVVLPLAVAAVVKAHDLLAGALERSAPLDG